jgi:hypothetical protein
MDDTEADRKAIQPLLSQVIANAIHDILIKAFDEVVGAGCSRSALRSRRTQTGTTPPSRPGSRNLETAAARLAALTNGQPHG